jgi:fructose/tagatose bisphosphate aldolase
MRYEMGQFVSLAQLLNKAREEVYAVGSFDCFNADVIESILLAGEEAKSPVILSATPETIDFMGIEYFVAVAKAAAENTSIPIALHLDHGTSL